jgi:hypothetical protein
MRKLFKSKGADKGKARAQPEAPSLPDDAPGALVETLGGLTLSDRRDREETKERFLKASQALRDALKAWKRWKYADSQDLAFPELRGEPEQFDAEFRNKLEKIMQARKKALTDKSIWAHSADTVLSIFTALSPFAKNFLNVAIQGQSVRGIFRGCPANCRSLFSIPTAFFVEAFSF